MLKVLVYADVDLNLIDGSSIWLSSLTEMLSGPGEIEVSIVQKTRLVRDLVIGQSVNRTNVRLIDPWEEAASDHVFSKILARHKEERLSPETAAAIISKIESLWQHDAIIVRSIETGLCLCEIPRVASRLWVYMTDPMRHSSPSEIEKTRKIYRDCERFLCQTEEAREAFLKIMEIEQSEKVSLLPPMIPKVSLSDKPPLSAPKLGYSGKFSPPYMINEMLDAFEKICRLLPGAEMHVVGDKFHNSPPVKDFEKNISQRLTNTPGVIWHGGVSRQEASEILGLVHVASSWRDKSFDNSLEMSTKILEYSSQGIPVLMNPSTVQYRIFGPDYPCYVESETDFINKFSELISSPELYKKVSETVRGIAEQYTFESVYEGIIPLLRKSSSQASVQERINILFSGHDFKFLKPILVHFDRHPSYNVLLDEHKGHVIRDTEKSANLLKQADMIFCEWCLGNAEWYSTHKRKEQLLIIRLHHQEINQDLPYLERIDWKNVDRIVFICPRNMELFLERIPEMKDRAVVIYNPIDCGDLGLSKLFGAGFNLGFVGLAPSRKSPHLALEIFETLRKQDSRYTLFFKGKSPEEYDWLWRKSEERSYYEAFYSSVKSSPHSNSIVFDPCGVDMPAWYSKIGFLLSTSEHEGSHQAVAEAMASGAVPVIRNWEGADQLYPEQFIFSSIDEAVDLVTHWNKAGNYESGCEMVKENARINFDASLIIEQYENLLNCLLSRSRNKYNAPADFDPEPQSFSVEMDKKYFPVFIDTLRMIQDRDFGVLENFFTKDFLTDKKQPLVTLSIKEYRPKKNLYYKHESIPLSPDIEGKGFEIKFPINWSADPLKDNTWVLFFQCLSWLNDSLLKGENGNENAMFTSFAVIQDWITSNAEWPAVHGSFVYGDHAVSIRLGVFYRALRLYKKSILFQDKEFFNILVTGILNHISLLASHEIYNEWHNHGIIVDRGLLEILIDFDEFKMKEEVQSLAIRRVVAQFECAFTAEGVHKEHSPCYHGSVSGWLLRCIDLIGKSGKSLPPVLRALARRTSDFSTYIMKPDGTFPNIGDCSGGVKYLFKESYLNNYPELNYVVSRGERGLRPSKLVKVFSDSGWAIFRDKWPADIYAVIHSDFNSLGHYQEDDTSLLISAQGQDLIIDSGLHSYNKNPLDIYMRKSRAHNVLVVDDIDFNSDLNNAGLSGITRFIDDYNSNLDTGGVVELTHPHYNHLGVEINRQFGQINATSFLVKDVIESGSSHKYTQLYHLAPGGEIENLNDSVFKVFWESHGIILWLKSGFDSYDIVEGALDPVQGWYFPKFAVSKPHPVLRLHRNGTSLDFETIIGITNREEQPIWDSLSSSGDSLLKAIGHLPRRELVKNPVPARWRVSRKER